MTLLVKRHSGAGRRPWPLGLSQCRIARSDTAEFTRKGHDEQNAALAQVVRESPDEVADETCQRRGRGDRGLDGSREMSVSGAGDVRGRRWVVLSVLCIAVLVVNIDSTILNVALPTLVRKLRATSSQLQWIVDAYAMVFGGLLLVAGSIADRVGRKRVFLTGFAVFAGGSLGAAFSGSVGVLIGFRAVMGGGAAMTIPAGLSILDDVFRAPRERARAVGVWGGTIGVGIAVGPLAGGLLLSRFWWGRCSS